MSHPVETPVAPAKPLSRRGFFAAAATSGAALVAEPALAQRCPAEPPPHVKGPAVFLDLDQHELDEAYDNDILAFNVKSTNDRRNENNKIAQGVLGAPIRVAYGESDIEKLDIYKTRAPNAPTLIFIHGGSWRNGSSSQFAVYAEPIVKAGANYVVLDFTSVKQTKGDLFPLVEQCRRGVAWVYRNIARYGGAADKIYLSARSSGSHVAACVLITEWEKQALPKDIVKGAVLGSGMYDLKPVRLSRRASYVTISDRAEQELSPIRHVDKINTPVFLANGGLETVEFLRQSREFAAALRAAGKPVQQIVAKGYNHYEMGETLGNPYAPLGRAIMEMMKLNQG